MTSRGAVHKLCGVRELGWAEQLKRWKHRARGCHNPNGLYHSRCICKRHERLSTLLRRGWHPLQESSNAGIPHDWRVYLIDDGFKHTPFLRRMDDPRSSAAAKYCWPRIVIEQWTWNTLVSWCKWSIDVVWWLPITTYWAAVCTTWWPLINPLPPSVLIWLQRVEI